jgi:hypothetical protein
VQLPRLPYRRALLLLEGLVLLLLLLSSEGLRSISAGVSPPISCKSEPDVDDTNSISSTASIMLERRRCLSCNVIIFCALRFFARLMASALRVRKPPNLPPNFVIGVAHDDDDDDDGEDRDKNGIEALFAGVGDVIKLGDPGPRPCPAYGSGYAKEDIVLL